ncbi:MAG: hypothetical protein H7A24_16980 [Leptospiraceae bacterium]|nr:hypothetical protein [Leptospiraceae bacterium]
MTIEYQDGKLPFDYAQGPKLTHVSGNKRKSFDQNKGFQPKYPPTKNQPFHPDSKEIQVP